MKIYVKDGTILIVNKMLFVFLWFILKRGGILWKKQKEFYILFYQPVLLV